MKGGDSVANYEYPVVRREGAMERLLGIPIPKIYSLLSGEPAGATHSVAQPSNSNIAIQDGHEKTVDLPIEHGDFPVRCVSLRKGNVLWVLVVINNCYSFF